MTLEKAIEFGKIFLKSIEDEKGSATYEFVETAVKMMEQEPCDDKGDISDGYHTFNQLYHQRAILFAVIINQNKDKAWKSYKHSDGKYCFDSNGEWFIVGIDTPEGSYTYHYSKEYWDMFDCKELECGKEWDGHTEEDVTRLLSLEQEPCEDAISRQAVLEVIEREEFKGDAISEIEKLSSVIPHYADAEIQKMQEMEQAEIQKAYGLGKAEQPKTGHWIKVSDGYGDNAYICECSECKDTVWVYKDADRKWNYCANCGCRMKGSE